MKNLSLIFAILTGLSAGSYSIFQKIGSTKINPALGAMTISIVAFFINLLVFLKMKLSGDKIIFTSKGLSILILVGIAAAGIDLFGLLSYSKGLKVTSSFIITGVQASLVLLVGFLLLKEPFSLGRLVGISLIILGLVILQKFGI